MLQEKGEEEGRKILIYWSSGWWSNNIHPFGKEFLRESNTNI